MYIETEISLCSFATIGLILRNHEAQCYDYSQNYQ